MARTESGKLPVRNGRPASPSIWLSESLATAVEDRPGSIGNRARRKNRFLAIQLGSEGKREFSVGPFIQ
jgi:hypothetical protein